MSGLAFRRPGNFGPNLRPAAEGCQPGGAHEGQEI